MSLQKLDVQAGSLFVTCHTVTHVYLIKLLNQHKIRHREEYDRYMGQNRDKGNVTYLAGYLLTVRMLDLVVLSSSLLGGNAASQGEWLPTFRRLVYGRIIETNRELCIYCRY
jgi:hypothetical protein